MTDHELGQEIGELKGSMQGLHERFNRHDKIHGEMQGDIKSLLKTVHWWKGGMAFGVWVLGIILGGSGVAILLWGTNLLAK